MIPSKSTSSLLEFALFLFLLLTLLISVYSSEPATVENNDINDGNDDESEFEELIALDEKEDEDQETQESGHAQSRPSETELLSMAQKVVLELNSDKVNTVFHENEFVLVLGYAPWCPRSAELMPNFAEAAVQLKELGSPLLMAKIDAERHPRAAANLGIRGFPTLLLFVNGSSQVYTGGFSADEIVIWVRKRTGVPVTRISSVTEAEELLRRHAMFFIGLFEKFEGAEYEEFLKASKLDNEIQFVEVSSSAVAEVLFPDIKTDNIFLGLVKSEPERYTKYEGTFRADKILEFLDYNKFPLVNILTELKSARVYSSPVKLQVFVFADVDDFNNLFGPLQDIARKFMSKIMFVLVDIREENLAKPFLTLFGLEESKDTVVTAFDNKISSKYLLESAPAPSKIEDFCLGLLSGTVTPYFKSEPIPDNKEEGVQIIVGKTFDSLVLGSPKNILLEVHAPWCFTCDTTSKQILMLAKHFNGSEDIVFAKIDASANEHPELQVHDYPTLLFYPANDKSNPIKLSPKSSLKDLAAFIRKNLKAQDRGTTKDEL